MPTGPMSFIDMLNRPSIWLEIHNTFVDLRFLLQQASAYKGLEPKESSPVSDPLCAYLHYQKMYMLNLAVFQLAKIQDLAVRLLQESFSGDLVPVDYNDDEWERKLTLKEAKKGLNDLLQKGLIANDEHQLIMNALDIPSKSPLPRHYCSLPQSLGPRNSALGRLSAAFHRGSGPSWTSIVKPDNWKGRHFLSDSRRQNETVVPFCRLVHSAFRLHGRRCEDVESS